MARPVKCVVTVSTRADLLADLTRDRVSAATARRYTLATGAAYVGPPNRRRDGSPGAPPHATASGARGRRTQDFGGGGGRGSDRNGL